MYTFYSIKRLYLYFTGAVSLPFLLGGFFKDSWITHPTTHPFCTVTCAENNKDQVHTLPKLFHFFPSGKSCAVHPPEALTLPCTVPSASPSSCPTAQLRLETLPCGACFLLHIPSEQHASNGKNLNCHKLLLSI